MSELQNDGSEIDTPAITPEVEVIETNENPEQGSELAPEVSEDEKKAKAQAAFNKQYGEKKQAERERDAALKKVQEIQALQQQAVTPQAIGEIPNEYDFDTTEEFRQAQSQYINNIKSNAQYEASQKLMEEQRQRDITAQQQSTYDAQQASAKAYTENAEKLGIDPQDLMVAGNTVNSYGVSEGVIMAILDQSNGPLITKYLAANPQEVDNLNNMNPYQAGAYMATLSEKAGALKPKPSNTPNPTTDIAGSGSDPESGKYKYSAGSTIEMGSSWD